MNNQVNNDMADEIGLMMAFARGRAPEELIQAALVRQQEGIDHLYQRVDEALVIDQAAAVARVNPLLNQVANLNFNPHRDALKLAERETRKIQATNEALLVAQQQAQEELNKARKNVVDLRKGIKDLTAIVAASPIPCNSIDHVLIEMGDGGTRRMANVPTQPQPGLPPSRRGKY